jgi:nicotinamidase-related amidase
MNSALVLIDIQQDYFPQGRMELVGAVQASESAAKLLNNFRKMQKSIIHIQHISIREGATYFLPNTEGINFHKNVVPSTNESIIQKHYPNSFRETGLQEYLNSKEIKELVICGMMSHMCIDATVRAAFDKGYSCIVAYDACATKNLSFNGNNIEASKVHGAYMAALGSVYAKILTSEEIINKQ